MTSLMTLSWTPSPQRAGISGRAGQRAKGVKFLRRRTTILSDGLSLESGTYLTCSPTGRVFMIL